VVTQQPQLSCLILKYLYDAKQKASTSTFDAQFWQFPIAKEVEYTKETNKKGQSAQLAKYLRGGDDKS